MISDLRDFPRQSSLDPASVDLHRIVAGRPLPLGCPQCREPIPLVGRLCGNRLIDAILLQAERIGAELECRKCGLKFIFHRSPQVTHQRHAPHQQPQFPHLLRQSEIANSEFIEEGDYCSTRKS